MTLIYPKVNASLSPRRKIKCSLDLQVQGSEISISALSAPLRFVSFFTLQLALAYSLEHGYGRSQKASYVQTKLIEAGDRQHKSIDNQSYVHNILTRNNFDSSCDNSACGSILLPKVFRVAESHAARVTVKKRLPNQGKAE